MPSAGVDGKSRRGGGTILVGHQQPYKQNPAAEPTVGRNIVRGIWEKLMGVKGEKHVGDEHDSDSKLTPKN